MMPLDLACLNHIKRHFIYVFMLTLHEDMTFNRYLDSGGGHFGFFHVTGVTEKIQLGTISEII